MRHYSARKRLDGQYDYTCGDYPVGYCAAFEEPVSLEYWREEQLKTYKSFKDKHHTDGHLTEEDACNCYKEYQLDHHLRKGTLSESMHRCRVCGDFTAHYIEVGYCTHYTLCDKHCNREEVEKLYDVGQSWES